MNKEEKDMVKKVLLLPIICKKKIKKISRDRNIIYTGQKYYGNADEDMSDVAVKFYEIVYENILKEQGGSLLDDKGYILNRNFAGDTINSFNSIANIVPGAGKTTKQRTNEDEWPESLKNYYSKYHCLANFWIIPFRIGRRGKKWNYYDSVDIFFKKLENKLEKKDYEAFIEKHFVCSSYSPLSIDETKRLYNLKNSERLIIRANNFMECRAEQISSDYNLCKKLYDFFEKEGIIGL